VGFLGFVAPHSPCDCGGTPAFPGGSVRWPCTAGALPCRGYAARQHLSGGCAAESGGSRGSRSCLSGPELVGPRGPSHFLPAWPLAAHLARVPLGGIQLLLGSVCCRPGLRCQLQGQVGRRPPLLLPRGCTCGLLSTFACGACSLSCVCWRGFLLQSLLLLLVVSAPPHVLPHLLLLLLLMRVLLGADAGAGAGGESTQ